MPGPITSPNTGTTMAARDAGSVKELWQKGCELAEQTADFFAAFEGKSKNSLIFSKTDTSKGAGHKITFTTKSGFYGRGKIGDENFTTEADFEKVLTNSYFLTVDYLRHASSVSMRAEGKMGMKGELKAGIPIEQGNWLGRKKSHRLFMMFREQVNSDNKIYANSKTRDTLVSADVLDWDNIVTMGALYKPLGGRPAMVGKSGKNTIFSNNLVASVQSLTSLKLDSQYQTILQNAQNRGDFNPLFRGDYAKVDGHIIHEYNPIDHDGVGAIGSPISPKAELGVAIVSAFTAGGFIKGGGSDAQAVDADVDFFEDFPNFAYPFNSGDVLAQDGLTHYVLIVNPPNAATDPGKIGMYAYTTGNDGVKLTITAALGTGTGRSGTVGGVTYNAGIWSGLHTEVHPQNATIIPCNSQGVPIGWTYMLGAGCALRGHGEHNRLRTTDTTDLGFIHQSGITSVFGQKLREDRRGRHIGVITLCHAVLHPGLNIPTIV